MEKDKSAKLTDDLDEQWKDLSKLLVNQKKEKAKVQYKKYFFSSPES